MERKLATIQKIKELHPIPNADNIEKAIIKGWSLVVKKNEFKVGDLVVYCEIDSIMPERPEFEFLRLKKFRIKTISLKNTISQGIAFPLTILESIGTFCQSAINNKWHTFLLCHDGNTIPIIEGEDVTEALGVTKYEMPIPAQLAGDVLGGFPSHSIKTDEIRIQTSVDDYNEFKKYKWIALEKINGTSSTFYVYNDKFGICSRNLELKENEKNTFWKVARQQKIEEKMRDYMKTNNLSALTLQGELIGEGIQKNMYKIKGHTIKFFRVFNPITYTFFDYNIFINMMIKIMGLDMVPIINDNFELPENYEDLIKYADGKSLLYETLREGIVFVAKNYTENNGRLSFKVISNKFILKNDE
jgi:RNA ligase (TIGR02306 family)